MAETNQLHKGLHLVHYGQLGLWDNEDPQAYPAQAAPLPWWGPKGVVVPAQNDTHVTVQIWRDDTPERDALTLLDKGFITIGGRGGVVGNITTADTAEFNLEAGNYNVSCYYGGPQPELANAILFLVEAT